MAGSRAVRLGALLLVLVTPAAAFEALSGLSYYMGEARGQVVLVELPADVDLGSLRAQVTAGSSVLARDTPVRAGRRASVSFSLEGLPPGTHEVVTRLRAGRRDLGQATAAIVRRPPRDHAVQVDRLSGGLRVDGLPFFPVGFYCYWPVQPTLAEEEVVRGFDVMSPYHGNDPAERDVRRAWMDRAAALGMKVHYHLRSLAGGLGAGPDSQADTSAARRLAWLRADVKAFRDHPALLAWYLADEPTGHGATPEGLQAAADEIRRLDPYHPVSIVFMNPGAAQRFAGAMDVAMTDPYPIPNAPPVRVARAVATVRDALAPRVPVWLVPQAFGGNEAWPREPTARELRLMSWLGILEDATGLQYFVRHGLSGFPKSPDTWAAAGRVALEVQALTPFLLSADSRPAVVTRDDALRAAAWRHGDVVVVAVANTENRPRPVEVELPDLSWSGDDVEVLYEDRVVARAGRHVVTPLGLLLKPMGVISDLLHTRDDVAPPEGVRFADVVDGYGVRLYRLAAPLPPAAGEDNLLLDPGFEWDPSPSIPAAVYADVGDGRGATAFVDGRLAHGGRRSLRLRAPAPGTGVRVWPFAPAVTPGHTYRLALWARSDVDGARLRLRHDASGDSAEVELTGEWSATFLDGTVPADATRARLAIALASAGTAWIDDLSLRDLSPRLEVVATPMGHSITIHSVLPEAEIHYRLDGEPASPESPRTAGPVRTTGPSRLRVALVSDGRVLARAGLDLYQHAALGRFVDLVHPYSPRYPAAGPGALADGILGTDRFADGRWQGFEADDLIAVIDLGRPVRVDSVRVRFLQSVASWIWLPRVMEVHLSDDGRHFRPFATVDHDVDEHDRRRLVRELTARAAPEVARYVRVHARSVGTCPAWHPGAGGPAWIFADEIRVEGE